MRFFIELTSKEVVGHDCLDFDDDPPIIADKFFIYCEDKGLIRLSKNQKLSVPVVIEAFDSSIGISFNVIGKVSKYKIELRQSKLNKI